MKKYLCLLILTLAVHGLAGCQDKPQPPPAEAKPAEVQPAGSDKAPQETPPPAGDPSGLTKEFLINQNFVLVKINEADFVENENRPAPTLEFGEGFLVMGKICNNFRGTGELTGDQLTVKTIASTKMMCPDQDLDKLEIKLFQMLESGVNISMNGARLLVKQGDTALTFEASTPKAN